MRKHDPEGLPSLSVPGAGARPFRRVSRVRLGHSRKSSDLRVSGGVPTGPPLPPTPPTATFGCVILSKSLPPSGFTAGVGCHYD